MNFANEIEINYRLCSYENYIRNMNVAMDLDEDDDLDEMFEEEFAMLSGMYDGLLSYTQQPICQVIDELNIECPICMNQYHHLQRGYMCNHSFCQTCIRSWNQYSKNRGRHRTCPLCRGC